MDEPTKFDSLELAEAYFTAAYDDGTFSISIVSAEDLDAQEQAYKHHWVCCGYGHEEIIVNGVKYIAIYDYGH